MKKKITILFFVAILTLTSLFAYTPNDRSSVNAFDRAFMNPYSKPLDTSASIINAALFVSPAIIAAGGNSDLLTLGVMYLETMGGAYATKEILKAVVERERPYTYFEGAPENKKDDWNKSFPSGHTALSFASASFLSYVFSKYYPESKWRIPVTLASFTAAATTAVLRIMSGNHFTSDVLAGAAIGLMWGLGVPMLHTLGDDVKMGATPFTLAFSVSL